MIAYEISATHPHRHFISFRAIFPVEGRSTIPIKIAAWRPGRYELGNFSKNIRAWRATNTQGEQLSFTKSDKDTWQVQCEGEKEIVVHYQYYASELNAGSSYLDETQLHINPVNCFFYDGDHLQQDYDLRFRLPDEYDIACQLTSRGPHHLYAHSFDELADSPLIASPSLTKHEYRAGDIPFYIHAQGPWNMDTSRLLSDFRAFSTLQIDIFGSIPCSKYDFLYQFPPYFVRHGVEHSASTVIAMGPASELGGEKLYNELLAISCHELFHTWNIKCIRPAAMLPYDFSKENYSPLGYVYEGVTTYYGDLVLLRCGVWSRERWLATFSDEVKTHLENPGIFNHSVSDSSMDTWLDGYGQGIPWRKV
ncbi:MAG: hypothetical protein JNM00_00365, partial [Flavobacteriales bacterium]|nr:hypothetical protein [Flavobacteriales bacterium]